MRITRSLWTVFYAVYAFIFSWVFLGAGRAGTLPFPAVFAMEIVSILLLCAAAGKIARVEDATLKKVRRFIPLFWAALFCVQILFTAAFQTSNNWGWDFDTVVLLAKALLNDRNVPGYSYLAVYPNNLLYFWGTVLIFAATRFLGENAQVFSLLVCNILVLDVSLFGIYKLVELLKGKRQAYFILLCLLLFTPYWFYLPIAYTDIFSLPFLVFPILLCVFYEKKKQNFFFLAGSGALAALGYHFKGTPVIAAVAVLLYMLLRGRRGGFGKRQTAVFAGSFAGTLLLAGWALSVSLGLLVPRGADTYKMPVGYWIYTGLVGSGAWNQEVVTEVGNFTSYEEKEDFLREAIAKRIEDYGVVGLAAHVFHKEAEGLWSRGTLNAEVYVQREPVHSGFVPRMLGEDSFYGLVYRCYSQGYWRGILLFFLIGMWYRVRQKNREEAEGLLYLTAFGILLFYTFWEINARYLVNSAWIILTMGGDSLYALAVHRKERKTYDKETG